MSHTLQIIHCHSNGCLLFKSNFGLMQQQTPSNNSTRFADDLADEINVTNALSKATAQQVFDYFKTAPLFRWQDANNDCEDRANAACLLLDAWGIANAKAWVFSGDFCKKESGQLTNLWNYHVAAAVPVKEEGKVVYYVIDPATLQEALPVDQWALQITQGGCSYHFIKQGVVYIFPNGIITKDNWFIRNKRNYNWTMQGLSGINGVSVVGKAQLAFKKEQVKKTAAAFRQLLTTPPAFLTAKK